MEKYNKTFMCSSGKIQKQAANNIEIAHVNDKGVGRGAV